MPSGEKQVDSDDDLHVIDDELKIIAELEKYIGAPIPQAKRFGGPSASTFYRTAFAAKDGFVHYLSINKKELVDLPESVSSLERLEYLYLRDNHLKTIPKCVRALGSLKDLDVFNNRITTIPDWIGDLRTLQRADLSRN
ncbi:MAG: leucine-rich repeat domain-containing protein, partial [Candidatus Hodarchaeota archaeon]